MRKILLSIFAILFSLPAFAQFQLDSSLYSGTFDNRWTPTQEKLEATYEIQWVYTLRSDSTRLRPAQYLQYMIDGQNLKFTLRKVTGSGNSRQSLCVWQYKGSIRDSISGEFLRDTTVVDSTYMPYTNWGEADCRGVVTNPATPTYKGKVITFLFPWVNEKVVVSTMGISGSGTSTQVKFRSTHSEIGTFSPSPIYVHYIPIISVEEK